MPKQNSLARPVDALIDFAIITAVKLEREAVCKAFGLTDKHRVKRGSRVYWRGEVPLKDGDSYQIVVAQSSDMANVPAALLTSDTIHHWQPGAILMVGIAAAATEELPLGDVIVGAAVYYYERGKVTGRRKKPEPVQILPDATLWNHAIAVAKWTVGIGMPRPDGKKAHPQVHYGVIASGEKVIAHAPTRDKIAEAHRKILAIEMEGYGVSEAVRQNYDQVRHLVIRALCDRGDATKNNEWQSYAAAAAAGFAKHFLRDRPLDPRSAPQEASSLLAKMPRSEPVRNTEPTPASVEEKGPQAPGIRWDVFISYSRKDEAIAIRIQFALEQRSIRVWRDADQIQPGDLFAQAIENGLERSASVALLVSPDSLTSGWVEEEYYRAISLAKRKENPIRVIPVLLRQVTLPGFLANRSWLDLQDDAEFESNIERLAQVVKQPPVQEPDHPGPPVNPKLVLISFMALFPEGLLELVYRRLVSQLNAESAAMWAEEERLVSAVQVGGIGLMGPDPKRISLLRSADGDAARTAGAVLGALDKCFAEDDPFADWVQLGVGRTLLVRDLLSLVRLHADKSKKGEKRRADVCQLARNILPNAIEEGHVRLGLEIIEALEALAYLTLRDDVNRARLLVRIGKSERALELFDLCDVKNFFAEVGLDDQERLLAAIDWARAIKDTGRAREMHEVLIGWYDQMLSLVHSAQHATMGEPNPGLSGLEADILNNRATQIAVYGKDPEWDQAQANFQAAIQIYKEVGDGQSLMAARANLVAHWLDRQGVRAPLDELLAMLNALDPIASRCSPSESLFFFYYQKARLLRRLDTQNLQPAIAMYQLARQVAMDCGLSHRWPIAQRWALALRKRVDDISENEYLQGLEECAAELRRHIEDAWATSALRATLVDMAPVLRNRGETERAWQMLVEAFEVQARKFERSKSDTSRDYLRQTLKLMDGPDPGEGFRVTFLQTHSQSLNGLLGSPAGPTFRWTDVHDWLSKEQKL